MPLTEMKTGEGQWPGGPKEELITTQWPALQEMLSQNFAPTTGCLLSEKEKKECAAGVGMGSAAPTKEQRKIIASYSGGYSLLLRRFHVIFKQNNEVK